MTKNIGKKLSGHDSGPAGPDRPSGFAGLFFAMSRSILAAEPAMGVCVFVITAVFSLAFLYEVPAPRTPLCRHMYQGHPNRKINESSISKIRTTINPSAPEFRVRRGSNGLTRIRMRVSLAPCDGHRQASTCGRVRHGSRSLSFSVFEEF